MTEQSWSDGLCAPDARKTRNVMRAYRLVVITVLMRPFGNLCLAWGMRHFSQALSINPIFYLRAMLNPFVAAGVGLLALGLLLRMALLSLADLSYVLPLSASGYLLSTLLGRFFLREQVSTAAWIGTILIFLGTIVVGPSNPKTVSTAGLAE